MQPNLIDIPKEFYPFESTKPFDTCMICSINLSLGTVDYFVEKAVKNNLAYKVQDIVFEYAICSSCALTMQESISNESQQNMQSFFASHQDFMDKTQLYMQGKGELPDDILSRCSISNQPTHAMNEYMLFGHFRGDKMIATTMPYVMGGKAMDELSELMSDETQDEMEGFKSQYFGGPSELESRLLSGWKDKPVFL